jgi:hypothetical protein
MLSQEAVEESLYKAAVWQEDDGSAMLRELYSGSNCELDDSGRGLKRSPAFQDDDEEGWNQTSTFYSPHPALRSGKNSLSTRETDDSPKKL